MSRPSGRPFKTLHRPLGLAVGADGNIWFTELAGNKIGKLTVPGLSGGCATPGRNCVLRIPVPAIRVTGPRP